MEGCGSYAGLLQRLPEAIGPPASGLQPSRDSGSFKEPPLAASSDSPHRTLNLETPQANSSLCNWGNFHPGGAVTPPKMTQQMNECLESNVWHKVGHGFHLPHRDLQLDVSSNPLPQPCSMPRATCPAPTCLPGSRSPFFLLIRGLSNDSTVPAILELSLISSAFRNNHHCKTLRTAGMQAGRTSTKQACMQACVCHPFLPVPQGTRPCPLSLPQWGRAGLVL